MRLYDWVCAKESASAGVPSRVCLSNAPLCNCLSGKHSKKFPESGAGVYELFLTRAVYARGAAAWLAKFYYDRCSGVPIMRGHKRMTHRE